MEGKEIVVWVRDEEESFNDKIPRHAMFEGSAILPPSYSRMLGRPKTKRAKHQFEKIIPSEGKLGRQQRSLKCGNCGVVGHNKKTCHRYLPPKENKKRKASNEGCQVSNQPKKPKEPRKPPMTVNELRAKLRENDKKQKDKHAAAKAAKLAAARSTSSTTRLSQVGARPAQRAAAPTAPNLRPPQSIAAVISRPAQSAAAPISKAKAKCTSPNFIKSISENQK